MSARTEFQSLVEAAKARGLSPIAALREVVKTHPNAHAKLLLEANPHRRRDALLNSIAQTQQSRTTAN